MKYQIEIEETLARVVEVEADSITEAIDKIEAQYKEEEIVLGGDDFADYTIKGV